MPVSYCAPADAGKVRAFNLRADAYSSLVGQTVKCRKGESLWGFGSRLGLDPE